MGVAHFFVYTGGMEGEIRSLIQKVLADLGLPEVAFAVERPAEMSHGDWACNVALILGKQIGENPKNVAEKILQKLQEQKISEIEKIEIAGPGFINFYCTRKFFTDTLKTILKSPEAFGRNETLKGKTVMVEYTQPNPFKPFHIGHLMSNTIGETLSRIIEFSGAHIIRANYQGDIGLHVAKALWGMGKKGVAPTDILGIGEAYAYGNEMYETDADAKKEIIEINKKIYAHDASVWNVYQQGRDASLAAFEKIYALLGTKFDQYFFESEVWESGKKIVAEGLSRGIFEKGNEGAIVFPGEKYGLHTRVFITRESVPTYEAKELGLVMEKVKRVDFDENITIL
jgi:arginyl-tRNA synthetase